MEVRLKALRQAIMEKREARRMLEQAKARSCPRQPKVPTASRSCLRVRGHGIPRAAGLRGLECSRAFLACPSRHQGSIRVLCRVRPPTGDEGTDPRKAAAMVQVNTSQDTTEVVLVDPRNAHGEKTIEFDGVFFSDMNQQAVYDKLATLSNVVLDGSNAALVAFGPAGAGKTHSMSGTDFERGLNESFGRGLLKALGELGDMFDSWSLTVRACAACDLIPSPRAAARSLARCNHASAMTPPSCAVARSWQTVS